MPTSPVARLVEEFSKRLLSVDLPALPPERRAEAAAFARRRAEMLPSPMLVGVSVVAVVVAGAGRLAGRDRVARVLARCPLPILGEYPRLVRALTYAYVWETWPSTATDGAPR
jgi:hypothetical protein